MMAETDKGPLVEYAVFDPLWLLLLVFCALQSSFEVYKTHVEGLGFGYAR